MEIAIKYPRKKFIKAGNTNELKKELNLLMVEIFDIKNSETKPFTDIKLAVETKKISSDDFQILIKNNSVIVPTIITQCKI